MNRIHTHWKENRSIWLQILLLFVVTHTVLFALGFISDTYVNKPKYSNGKSEITKFEHPYLQTWAVFDSEWYMKIAKQGYSDVVDFKPNQYSSIGFFPLYPAVVATLQLIIRDFLLAGWIVSNIFFILSAYFLYKLVKLDHDDATAKRSLWYLFLFPSAYIFSAVYPESMLLCTWLISIYYARNNIWWLAGLAGFVAAFIKPTGFIIFIPLVLIYIFKGNILMDIKKLLTKDVWNNITPNIVYTLLPILGLAIWGFGNYLITGDFMAYSNVQQGAWNHKFSIPFVTLYRFLFYSSDYYINSLTVMLALVVLFFGYKRIPFSYWVFALVAILFNSATGTVIGSWRYLASVFPLIIILSFWGKSETVDRVILVAMSLLQGCLFVFWVAGYWFVS